MLYESQQDLKNQRQAQQVVEEMFGWDLQELNIRYHADWIAYVDKKPHALIEYKRRHCEHDRYDTVFLEKLCRIDHVHNAFAYTQSAHAVSYQHMQSNQRDI